MRKTAVKLLLLVCAGTGLFFVDSLIYMGMALIAVLCLYGVTGFGPRTVLRQIRPVLIILVVLFVAQGLLVNWTSAGIMVLRFMALILLAAWVTLTTPATQMIEAMVAGLSPFVKRPRRISFVISLTWRFIPLVQTITNETKEAQRARGSKKINPKTTAVPVIVRTLVMADTISEALDARGFESSS